MRFQLPVKYLYAVSLAVVPKSSHARPEYHGVFVDTRDEKLTLTATDGHDLISADITDLGHSDTSFILALDWRKLAKYSKPTQRRAPFDLTCNGTGLAYILQSGSPQLALPVQQIDAAFPDWHQFADFEACGNKIGPMRPKSLELHAKAAEVGAVAFFSSDDQDSRISSRPYAVRYSDPRMYGLTVPLGPSKIPAHFK